jgi:hypothetical protein
LERFGIAAGATAALLWLVGLFLLEGAGNPAGPSGGQEIVDFYRDDRVAILIASSSRRRSRWWHSSARFRSWRCEVCCCRAGSAGSGSSSRSCC